MDKKEEMRQRRREAYQKAKAERDADPHYQALKQKAKDERKKKYQDFKNQHNAVKRAAKEKRIAEKDAALMELVRFASEWSEKKNRTDIQ